MRGTRSLLVPVVLLLLACTKSESGTPGPSASASTSAPAASSSALGAPSSESPVASAAPSASAADSASPIAAKDAPKKTDAGGLATASPSASAAPAECGTKPLPDCPLQAWMKSNANPPVMTSNLPALAIALDKIVGFAPSGYTNWASVAKDGAAAARNGDLAAAKASCRTCHDQYKQKYKTEIRARKI